MLLQAAIYISLRGYTLRQINIKEWASLSSLNHAFPLPAPIPLNEEREPDGRRGAGGRRAAPAFSCEDRWAQGAPRKLCPGTPGCRGAACPPPARLPHAAPAPPPQPLPARCLLAYEKCSNNEWLLFTEVISCYISIIAWICLAPHTTPLPTTMNF